MRTIEEILSKYVQYNAELYAGKDAYVVTVEYAKKAMEEAAKEVLEWVCEHVEAQEEEIIDPVVGSYFEHPILRGHVMEALNYLK